MIRKMSNVRRSTLLEKCQTFDNQWILHAHELRVTVETVRITGAALTGTVLA